MTSEQSISITTTTENTSATVRQRKRRKWDQPAESLTSDIFSLGNMVGIKLPTGMSQSSTTLSVCPVSPAARELSSLAPLITHNASAVLQKFNQTKIQEELAREIVINDAETSVRFQLTRRQTQEEIQRCTGAVVITRGKYRPPNAISDLEKPLYLHISAGAHLQETAERIRAVDHAAAMVEEILKQGINPLQTVGQITQLLNTCVYLGIDIDPSLNIAAHIRGPNDQYINHIMNETGATVILRGRGSRALGSPHDQDLQEPLHLYLSSYNLKGLEDAKVLAENLLATISSKHVRSRNVSSMPYKAVPPPQQLLTGVPSSRNEQIVDVSGSVVASSGSVSGENMVCHSKPSYSSGYDGIYPQLTPLQQVALALRQAPASSISSIAVSEISELRKSPGLNNVEETMAPQKRKFKELPTATNGQAKSHQQVSEGNHSQISQDSRSKNISSMPPPRKLVQLSSSGTLIPKMGSPPPPIVPKTPTWHAATNSESSVPPRVSSEAVLETLIKLNEYGEDDDEDDEELLKSKIRLSRSTPKPFWAL